jgi:hypothetical protein
MTGHAPRGIALALVAAVVTGCPTPRAVERSPEPPALGPAPAPAPPPTVTTLPSGLRVVSYPARDGVFAAALVVGGGPLDDPRGMEGLTGFTAEAALLATTEDPDRETRPERRALTLGGRVDVVHDGVMVGWRVEGPATSRGPLLRLLRDVAIHPDFPATRVQARAEMLREQREQVRTRTLADGRAWAIALALGIGRPLGGAPADATLARVNREDVARHHARLFQPDRAVIVTEGASADVVAQVFRDWTPRAGAAPLPDAVEACPAGRVFQGWLPAPERDAAVFVALPVPGPSDPLRPALDELLLAESALDDGIRPRVELHDRGDRAVLLLIVTGMKPGVLEPVDRWLGRLTRADSAGRSGLGARLRRATRLLAMESPLGRLVTTARVVLDARPAESGAASDADRDAVRGVLANEDHRVRVGVGPDEMRRRVETWGPTRALPRQGAICDE